MTFSDYAGSFVSPVAVPGSPPELSGSKSSKSSKSSSKSSSFHSSYQSDNSILSDVGNFEDIGLDDESTSEAGIGTFEVKTTSNPYDASLTSDRRNPPNASARRRSPMPAPNGNRAQRELTAGKTHPHFPSLRGHVHGATAGLGLLPMQNGARMGLASPSVGPLPMMKRNRSSSPGIARIPSLTLSMKVRRASFQANRERKTAEQLEMECDEDDGDDVPDECFLENVPMSPRPKLERTKSTPPSAATSPERSPGSGKERVKSVGNGTSPRPAEQGELRSPKPQAHRGASMGQFPFNHNSFPNGRAKSWNDALSELSGEAKALTEALEAHAADAENKPIPNDPMARRSFNKKSRPAVEKPRIKSALAELPPLRRTDIMIDPLPISKEKEAVLSRTRPSWLPPKCPAEEKRHLKEYQKMMTSAMRAEQERAAQEKNKITCRDDTASSLLRIWEEHVLPNWDDVTRQKRTRELWWRGIAPRSRGTVWEKAIGNQLSLSGSSYTAALRRAHALETTIKSGSQLSPDEEKKKMWLKAIQKDVKGTYPELRIFQAGGPLHGALLDVLKAYAMYRSDIGYVPGTSTIAALLLLNLPTPAASFSALSNLLNRPIPLSFHTGDSGAIKRTYALLSSTLKLKSPRLAQHLASLASASTAQEPTHTPGQEFDAFLNEIFTSLFTGSLSLDNATRLWDVMVFEGDAILVRAAVAFLTAVEGTLFGCESLEQVERVVRSGLGELGEEEWMNAVRSAGKA